MRDHLWTFVRSDSLDYTHVYLGIHRLQLSLKTIWRPFLRCMLLWFICSSLISRFQQIIISERFAIIMFHMHILTNKIRTCIVYGRMDSDHRTLCLMLRIVVYINNPLWIIRIVAQSIVAQLSSNCHSYSVLFRIIISKDFI